MQVVAESIQVLNQVHVALPFLVTTADDSKDVPTEEVRLRFLSISNHVLFSSCAYSWWFFSSFISGFHLFKNLNRGYGHINGL
jgi:hypothetical protein